MEKELAILQQLHHPHLVSFMFIADQGSRISIVMDWAGENLREHRTVTQTHQYTEDVARYMMYQLTSALVYLHSKVRQTYALDGGMMAATAGQAMIALLDRTVHVVLAPSSHNHSSSSNGCRSRSSSTSSSRSGSRGMPFVCS